MFFHVTSIIQ